MNEDHCDHDPIPQKEIQRNIDQYGCYIIQVKPDDYLPGFAYTIGLYQQFSHPEIICFGLSLNLLGSVLNDACELIKNGQPLQVGVYYDDFIADYPMQFLTVDKSFYPNYWGIANSFYGHYNYPALQLVWPDKQSLFPWEPGFNVNWKYKQPLLDRDTDFKFYEERNLAVYTTKYVLEGKPILYVYHNDDGAWQFHSEPEPDLKDAKLVSLESITRLDPGINELYHLSLGQSARRGSMEEEWGWE
ncbi:DUF4262 domain-containing protein [Chitinophaga sp. RAB17]|uniref:DUF4262 domain-containing protein n=1 Tax=Chitinophaga sp. RAB17 TaxID=3233049 RepID=UPI003F924D61